MLRVLMKRYPLLPLIRAFAMQHPPDKGLLPGKR
jgi:hypothetical protein